MRCVRALWAYSAAAKQLKYNVPYPSIRVPDNVDSAPVVSRMATMLRMLSAYNVALAKAFGGEVSLATRGFEMRLTTRTFFGR